MNKERARANSDSYANNASLDIYPFAFLTKGLNKIVGFKREVRYQAFYLLNARYHSTSKIENVRCHFSTGQSPQ